MTATEILADLVMLLHAAFSLFVVGGLLLILAGTLLRWRWTRNRRFRLLHLAATMFAVVRVWIALPCPFSVAEDSLRRQITAACPLGNQFHNVLHRLAFRGKDPHRFAQSTTLVGAAVLVMFILNVRKGSTAGRVSEAEKLKPAENSPVA